ncbi:MAG TPA: HYR domain-containing protein, partial [Rubrobacter sp.]|nr:HYR domain-containing protein [Rubrobacter sp.]
ASGLTFGIDPQNLGNTDLALSTLQVLVAGFGAMAFFRSSIFVANIQGQEVGVGPSTLLQTILTASDKAVDRTRAKARAKYVASVMDGVSAPKAERSLPVHSIALMQNLSKENQEAFAKEVRTLYDTAMNNQVRTLNLGLLIMNYMGQDVLRAAVNSLHDVIRGDTPSVEISSPLDRVTYGLNETVKAAYICKGEPGGAEVESCMAPVQNGEDIDTTTLGEKEFTVTAEDKNGNSHTVTHVYKVVDKDPPELEVPDDITVEARDERGARVFFQPTAKDFDPPKPDVVCNRASGEFFGLGITTVTCTAEDKNGNVARDYFKVKVEDTTGPMLRVPPGGVIYAEAQNADGAEVDYVPLPSATDAVDGDVDVECDPYPNSILPIGGHTVKCWALDEAGNKTTGKFKVVVRDTTAPDLQTPEDMTIKGPGNDGAQVEYKVSANDAVDGDQIELRCDPPSGSVFPIGNTAVTCTAIDKAGNETTRTFTVTVEEAIDDPGIPA